MPYRVQWEGSLGAYTRFTGVVTPRDLAAVNQEITDDARFDELRYTLGDFRGAQGQGFDLANHSALASPYAALIGASHANRNIRAAFVVDDAGIAELMDALTASGLFPYPARVFRTLDDARDWLASNTISFKWEPESR